MPIENPFRSFILGNIAPSGVSIPEWARDLRVAREATANQDFEKAEKLLSGILDAHQEEILVAMENVRIPWKKGQPYPHAAILRDVSQQVVGLPPNLSFGMPIQR